ncbi:MAG: RNA-binding protein [Thermoproteota archaeon]|nr:MAG: RNA-binding protein [Candidatus Korarchaeota archaeon]RLG55703.1 MAG: RNA-binding protein [Candidatus Korarchaeota archaeon]
MRPAHRRVISLLKKEYIKTIIKEDKIREDGRHPLDYRKIEIKARGGFTKGEGEAWVRLGRTQVLAGVKIDVGDPYPDSPDTGVLITHEEPLPLASPTFEPGPPDENAIELARVVDRGIRSAEAVDLKQLVIPHPTDPGRNKVYLIFLDIHILDHDGNLQDASALAGIAALMTTVIPEVKMTEDGKLEANLEKLKPLPTKAIPVSVTIAKIGDTLIVDPNLTEEEVADSRITITVDDHNRVCAIQMLGGSFTPAELELAIDIATVKSRELIEKVKAAVKEAEANA